MNKVCRAQNITHVVLEWAKVRLLSFAHSGSIARPFTYWSNVEMVRACRHVKGFWRIAQFDWELGFETQ